MTGPGFFMRFFYSDLRVSEEKWEVRTTWDEVTKTPGADRKGEEFTSTSTSTKLAARKQNMHLVSRTVRQT